MKLAILALALAPRLAHADCSLTEAKLPLTPYAEVDDVALADFNGDGKLDVAFSEMVGRDDSAHKMGGKVRVFLGKGDGTFGKPIDTAIPVNEMWRPEPVAADFNGDGKVDLVLADTSNPSHGDQSYVLLLGKGNGAFGKPIVATRAVAELGNVRAADLDGDNKADVVAAGSLAEASGITVLPGRASGLGKPFQIKGRKSMGIDLAYRNKFVWELADVDGDGVPEIIVAPEGIVAVDFDRPEDTGAGNYGVCVVRLAKGTFGKSACFGSNEDYAPEVVAVADFNGDGKPDIVSGPPQHSYIDNTHRIHVLLNKGKGTFETKPTPVKADLSSLPNFWALGAADVTGDGKGDIIAVGHGGDGTIALVLPGKGDGSFPTAVPVKVPYEANGNAARVHFGAFRGPGTLGFTIEAYEGPNSVVHVYSGTCR